MKCLRFNVKLIKENREIPLIENSFKVDVDEIIKVSKRDRVKLIFLVNPNNPTASVILEKEIEMIIKKSSAIVVVDEVYREFYGQSVTPLVKRYSNLVILRSFSKFAALAGARVGYLIANPELSRKFDGIRFPMGVSYLSYKLAEYVLEKEKSWIKRQVKMIVKERERLAKELRNLGFYVYPSFANFLLVKIADASNLCRKLKQKNIILRDRSSKKYLKNCIRITVRSPKENNQLIKVIKEVL